MPQDSETPPTWRTRLAQGWGGKRALTAKPLFIPGRGQGHFVCSPALPQGQTLHLHNAEGKCLLSFVPQALICLTLVPTLP